MITSLTEFKRYIGIRNDLSINIEGIAYTDDDFELNETQPTYESATQVKFASSDVSSNYVSDMICKFDTDGTEKIKRIVSVSYDSTDTILTFEANTFDNSNVENFARLSLDVSLLDFIKQAQSIIESGNITNRNFEVSQYVEKFYGDDSEWYYTDNFPIDTSQDITLITYSDSEEIDTDDYHVFNSNSGGIKYDSNFNSDTEYQITYSAGFTSIPEIIKNSILELAYYLYRQSPQGEGLLGKKNIGGNQSSSVTYEDILNKIKDKCINYRRVNV
jgi:hypothetical protein